MKRLNQNWALVRSYLADRCTDSQKLFSDCRSKESNCVKDMHPRLYNTLLRPSLAVKLSRRVFQIRRLDSSGTPRRGRGGQLQCTFAQISQGSATFVHGEITSETKVDITSTPRKFVAVPGRTQSSCTCTEEWLLLLGTVMVAYRPCPFNTEGSLEADLLSPPS